MPAAPLDTLYQHLLDGLDSAPAEARRLFHGRGQCWPGLEQVTVDWLEGVLLVALFRAPDAAWRDGLEARLNALGRSEAARRAGLTHILVQHRYLRETPCDWLLGEPLAHWQISEDGLRYRLDLGRAQNTGLFLDMRNGRRWVREQAAGRRVLNLFAYTCGFSVAALAGGAARVLNLDMAGAALARGRDNHRLNGHDLQRVGFLAHDLLRSWGKLGRLGPFDLIVLDPPSYQKGSFSLQRDLPKILRRLPGLLAPGGQVLACINDPGIGPGYLLEQMAAEAPGLRFGQRLDNLPEFADLQPDGGLKAMVFALTATAG